MTKYVYYFREKKSQGSAKIYFSFSKTHVLSEVSANLRRMLVMLHDSHFYFVHDTQVKTFAWFSMIRKKNEQLNILKFNYN